MSQISLIITITALLLLKLHDGTALSFLCESSSNSGKTIFETDQASFFVYTNVNPNPTPYSCNKNCDLRNLNFNPNLPTTVIIHGFLSDHSTDWIQTSIRSLLKTGQMNIIVVDWSGFITFNYLRTASKTPDIAGQIYKLLVQLAQTSNTDLTNWPYIHFIGHSMGAHVAGQAALMLREKVFVHRITAIDPAKPYFYKDGAHLKLHKSHAQFVDVIHTNSAPNSETLGLYEPLGSIWNDYCISNGYIFLTYATDEAVNTFHSYRRTREIFNFYPKYKIKSQRHIDFYPNGGDRQPGCNILGKRRSRTIVESLQCLSKLVFGVDLIALKVNYLARKLQGDDMLCDHREGLRYLIETITGKSLYVATKVESNSGNSGVTGCPPADCIAGNGCVEMGINANRYIHPYYRGSYYVNTTCYEA